eukprot:jgi/Mesvir1/1988/Mv05849-RA.1
MNEGPSGDLQAAVNMLAMAKGHIRGGTAPSRTTDTTRTRGTSCDPRPSGEYGIRPPGRIRKLVERQVKASLERQDRARVEKEKAKFAEMSYRDRKKCGRGGGEEAWSACG